MPKRCPKAAKWKSKALYSIICEALLIFLSKIGLRLEAREIMCNNITKTQKFTQKYIE